MTARWPLLLAIALIACDEEPAPSPADASPDMVDMTGLADMSAPRFPTGSTCKPPAAATDAPCAESEDCGPHMWCQNNRCAPAAPRGEPCSDGVFCAAGLACAFPDTSCGDVPGEGDACALTRLGPFGCPQGLGCRDGLCGPLPAAGEPCAMDNRCAAGLGCDFTPAGSVCATPRGVGEPCQNDQICAAGASCDYRMNRCAAHLATGDLCTLGNECGPQGACLPADAAAETFRCLPLPTADQPCIDACADDLSCVRDR